MHAPLLPEQDETRVLDVIPPPELHLLLGIVNHLFVGFKKAWPMASEWPNLIHLKPVAYHGGQSFNGPDCHKLLQSIDKIEELAHLQNAFQAQPWIHAFRLFKQVVHSCFGMVLEKNFEEKISSFKSACTELPISITPKLHILFHHVKQFIDLENLPLGIFSEQASESVHHHFGTHWSQRYKRDMMQPDYEAHLLQAVIDYNSKHI